MPKTLPKHSMKSMKLVHSHVIVELEGELMDKKDKKKVKKNLSKISSKILKDIEKYSNGSLAKGVNANTLAEAMR